MGEISAVHPAGQYTRELRHDIASEKAKEFEAVFLGQVFDQMLSTVDVGSMGGGQAEETWKSFLAQEYGKQVVSSTGGIGIAASIEGALQSYELSRQR